MLLTTYVFHVLLYFHLTYGSENNTISTEIDTDETCAELYEKGVGAYLDNNFKDCVKYLETAIRKYKAYSKKIQNCRLRCHEEVENVEPLSPVDIEDLFFYEKTVRQTLCLLKCKSQSKEIIENLHINKETERLFEAKKPYEYIHICYFQTKELQKAASAAFTYLVSHPEDKIMSTNLKYYSSMDNVDKDKIVNFEAKGIAVTRNDLDEIKHFISEQIKVLLLGGSFLNKIGGIVIDKLDANCKAQFKECGDELVKEYVYLYAYGADSYRREDWKYVINYMEESLSSYLHSENECRAQCEGPFDMGWFPDFIPTVANHFTYCLKCKIKCEEKMSSLNGERNEDLVASHYHYLQFAYFKMKKLKEACEAVASYLLFHPNDETMLSNMRYYRSLPKVEDEYFKPRVEAIRYVQRKSYEEKLMKFIMKEFTDPVPESEAARRRFRVLWTDKELKGQNRLVSEGLATPRECRKLVNIAKLFGVIGDGYEGKASPHSAMEKFTGLSIERAILLARIGLLHRKHLELYLELTEDAKDKIKDHFNLKKDLHFSYTHLVCRSALPDSPKNRTDLSHEIHADNCNIFPDGYCDKSPPSFTWRDYSAILYLNSNFEGGEFIFAADPAARRIQGSVKPSCGRMVAFSSGKENLHGVKAVRSGTRCAIGMWFTFDPEYKEEDRENANKLLFGRGEQTSVI